MSGKHPTRKVVTSGLELCGIDEMMRISGFGGFGGNFEGCFESDVSLKLVTRVFPDEKGNCRKDFLGLKPYRVNAKDRGKKILKNLEKGFVKD